MIDGVTVIAALSGIIVGSIGTYLYLQRYPETPPCPHDWSNWQTGTAECWALIGGTYETPIQVRQCHLCDEIEVKEVKFKV